MGYYSNQYQTVGPPVSCDWTFYDAFDTSNTLIQINGYPFLNSHTGVWPNAAMESVCSVTFVSLDAYNYDQRILSIPFMIDGVVVPETADYSYGMGVTIDMPEGSHTIEAPSFGGALDFLQINGYDYYTNVVNVTISELTAVNAYYHNSVNVNVGCVSSISSMVFQSDQNYLYQVNPEFGLNPPQGTPAIMPVTVFSDSDSGVYAGVAGGAYAVGVVDSPPTDAEWASMPNLQLYAVGYSGDPNANYNVSDVIWMVTNNVIYTTSISEMAEGIFISWARATAMQSQDQYHYPVDMTGGPVVDSNLQPYTPLPNQTQSFPCGEVSFNDITYMVTAYIAYYYLGTYNPYIDFSASGSINFNDITAFVSNYIKWETVRYGVIIGPVGGVGEVGAGGSLAGAQDSLGQAAAVSLDGPSVLPCVGSSFNVTFDVSNVSDLWAWDTGMSWNPNVLALTNITKGPFLAGGGSTLFLNSFNGTSPSNGVLQDMGDVLMSSSTVSGSGNLATLTFQVLSNGPVNITLTGTQLESPDAGSGIQQIPFTANNLEIAPLLPPPAGYFAAVQHGTNNQDWTLGTNPNPVNTTIGVDLTLNNASDIWSWSIPTITWNPQVLQLLNVTEGSFLANNTCEYPTVMSGSSPSQFDNVDGTIVSGLSETIQGIGVSEQSSGVVATLWFNVTGSGQANITLSGATLYASAEDNTGTLISTVNPVITVYAPPTDILYDNFENGLSNWYAYGYPYWASPTEEPTITSAEAYGSTYSAYFPGGYDTDSSLSTSFTAQSTLDFRFYMYLAGPYQSSGIACFYPNNGDAVTLGLNSVAGQFSIDYYNNNDEWDYLYSSSTVNVPANTWFCVELAMNATNFTLYYNGAAVMAGTFIDGPTGSFYYAGLGNGRYGGSVPAFYIDDVVISTSYVGP